MKPKGRGCPSGSVAIVLKVVTFGKYQNSFRNFRILNFILQLWLFIYSSYDCGKLTFDDLKSLFFNFFSNINITSNITENVKKKKVRWNNKKKSQKLSCHFILSHKLFKAWQQQSALAIETLQTEIIVFILVMKAINYLPLNRKIYSTHPWKAPVWITPNFYETDNRREKGDNASLFRQVHSDKWQKTMWLLIIQASWLALN